MRFTPHHGIYAYVRTNRKLKAAERRLRLDREKFPLFAAEIAESQPTPEELLDARGKAFVENQQANRDREARNWWRARAELRAIPEPGRAAFVRYWDRCKCPGNAVYLLTYINMFRDDRLIVHEGEVRPRSEVEWERDRKAKIAANVRPRTGRDDPNAHQSAFRRMGARGASASGRIERGHSARARQHDAPRAARCPIILDQLIDARRGRRRPTSLMNLSGRPRQSFP